MAIEIATAIEGQISEDDKESWLSVEEFKKSAWRYPLDELWRG